MTKGGIYAFLNLITGMYYIGSTKDFYKRYHSHKSLLNNGKHDNSYFQRAWTKYGQLNFIFVILAYVEDETKLEEVEQYWLDLTQCYDRTVGYNVRRIANSSLGVLHTQETKNKISKTKSDVRMTDEARENMSKSSANRDKIKWPCIDGSRCKCEKCKEIHRIRNREHSREWREWNRAKYNQYARDYRASLK